MDGAARNRFGVVPALRVLLHTSSSLGFRVLFQVAGCWLSRLGRPSLYEKLLEYLRSVRDVETQPGRPLPYA